MEPEPPTCVLGPERPAPTVSTLAVCGDVMTHLPDKRHLGRGAAALRFPAGDGGCPPWIQRADYAVANFETTMAGGPRYSGYPTFNAPDDLAYDLKEMGFDLVLTANNHSLDKGWAGVRRTLDVLDEAGLAHVGTSRTQEEADNGIVVADVGGISVAFLGYTYGTNGIPLPKSAPFAVNVYNIDYLTHLAQPDYDRLKGDLDKAAALDTDLVAVMIHWGRSTKPSRTAIRRIWPTFSSPMGRIWCWAGTPMYRSRWSCLLLPARTGIAQRLCVLLSGQFYLRAERPLTDTTAVLTLELTRDNITGETRVTGCDYAPMLMLDREAGAADRFELLDASAVAESETWPERVRTQARQAVVDCGRILGDSAVLTAAMNGGDGDEARIRFS